MENVVVMLTHVMMVSGELVKKPEKGPATASSGTPCLEPEPDWGSVEEERVKEAGMDPNRSAITMASAAAEDAERAFKFIPFVADHMRCYTILHLHGRRPARVVGRVWWGACGWACVVGRVWLGVCGWACVVGRVWLGVCG